MAPPIVETRGPRGLQLLSAMPAVADPARPPILFVHGLGHGAWCWENWLPLAAEAGHPAYAVSLTGHAGSPGRLRTATLGRYVRDVVATADALPGRPVLVGHSMGGLVVQRTLARYAAHAGVLVAPVPAHPAVGSLLSVARQHPGDAVRLVLGASLPLRPDYLFHRLDPGPAQAYADRCGPESPLAQYQLLMHLPSPSPRGGAPLLVLSTPEDRLVPHRDVRRTAQRYHAHQEEFSRMGHDLMLDEGWEAPLQAVLDWLASLPAPSSRP